MLPPVSYDLCAGVPILCLLNHIYIFSRLVKSLVTFVSSSIPCTLAPVFPLLGGAQQTPRQPRSRGSFPRPLEILLLHTECLGHVLAPQRVPALLVILPPHPEGAEAARLARLGAEAGGAPQVEQRRRVQVMSEEVTVIQKKTRKCQVITLFQRRI